MIQVIVPFYNCEAWIARTLYTLNQQKNVRFNVIVMDDASTDPSGHIAEVLCRDYGFIYHRSDTNMKCPYTIFKAVSLCGSHPDTILFILDGDDFLPDDLALSKVQAAYDADPELWLAYGKYESVPYDSGCHQAHGYLPEVIAARSFRSVGPRFNHPLTFRAWLFNRINPKDLQTPSGDWLQLGYDRALMYPLLEMATHYDGTCHWTVMSDILYSYNSINPNSEINTPPAHDVGLVETYRKKVPQWPQYADGIMRYEESDLEGTAVAA